MKLSKKLDRQKIKKSLRVSDDKKKKKKKKNWKKKN